MTTGAIVVYLNKMPVDVLLEILMMVMSIVGFVRGIIMTGSMV